MRFQLVKCNIMQITRKRKKKINASHSLEGTVLDNVEKELVRPVLEYVVRFGTHKVYFFKMDFRRFRKEQLDL